MRVRFLGQFWHVSLVSLWFCELLAVLLSWPLVSHVAGFTLPEQHVLKSAAIFGSAIALAMVAFGLFSRRMRERLPGILLRVTLSTALGAAMAGLVFRFALHPPAPIRLLVGAGAAAWVFVILFRTLASSVLDERVAKRRILVVGTGRRAAAIAQLRRRSDQRGFKLVGYVVAAGDVEAVPAAQILPPSMSLLTLVQKERVDEIVVAIDDRRRNLPIRDLIDCRLAGVHIVEVVSFLERETGKVHLELLHPSWIIFADGFRRDLFRRLSERVLDMIVSTAMLVVLSPLMLLVALAIKMEDGLTAPVLYSQPRVGLKGVVFRVLKFRSMRTDAESDGQARWAQPNDSRITRVGAFMRKTRIDELPQMLNVLKGQMSLVGPRPERPEFVQRLAALIPYYQERHTVKPGITGWAQLSHSYGASDQDAMAKLEYDLFYVKNHGLVFDLMILLRTCEVILFGKGAR